MNNESGGFIENLEVHRHSFRHKSQYADVLEGVELPCSNRIEKNF